MDNLNFNADIISMTECDNGTKIAVLNIPLFYQLESLQSADKIKDNERVAVYPYGIIVKEIDAENISIVAKISDTEGAILRINSIFDKDVSENVSFVNTFEEDEIYIPLTVNSRSQDNYTKGDRVELLDVSIFGEDIDYDETIQAVAYNIESDIFDMISVAIDKGINLYVQVSPTKTYPIKKGIIEVFTDNNKNNSGDLTDGGLLSTESTKSLYNILIVGDNYRLEPDSNILDCVILINKADPIEYFSP